MTMAEMEMSVKNGTLQVDGKIVVNNRGDLSVSKAAVEPVWYLPGVAKRFGIDRKSTSLNSSHSGESRMPSSA